MPVEVKAYTCQFKCGRHASKNKNGVEAHEQVCYKNPANKSCMTCKHDGRKWEDNYRGHCMGEPYGPPIVSFFCALNIRSDDVKVIYHCEKWEPTP